MPVYITADRQTGESDRQDHKQAGRLENRERRADRREGRRVNEDVCRLRDRTDGKTDRRVG